MKSLSPSNNAAKCSCKLCFDEISFIVFVLDLRIKIKAFHVVQVILQFKNFLLVRMQIATKADILSSLSLWSCNSHEGSNWITNTQLIGPWRGWGTTWPDWDILKGLGNKNFPQNSPNNFQLCALIWKTKLFK